MKKNSWIPLAIAIVVLIAVSVILYNVLGDKISAGGLAQAALTEEPPEAEPTPSASPESTPEPTKAEPTPTKPAESAAPEDLPDAPGFRVEDMSGELVTFSGFKGKPVVINFWASWCDPCKKEMPHFNKLYEEIGDEVEFMMINSTDGSRETVKTAKEFVEECGYTFPVYFDTQHEASIVYGASGLPITFFINADGKVVAYYSGYMREELLLQGIDIITD